MLAYTKENYSVSGLHVGSATKKQKTQLSGLFREDGLRRMTDEENYFAVETAL